MSKRGREGLSVFEANMRQAMDSYYARTGDEGVSTDMPFDDMLAAEDDGQDGSPGEYEFAQRAAGVRGLFRYLTAEGPEPLKIMKRLYAAGRGLGIAPFCNLTMTEAALMFSESRAAHSWRVKMLSGMIEAHGMRGSRLPGQKTKAASLSYSVAQQGNSNRKGTGKRRAPRKTK